MPMFPTPPDKGRRSDGMEREDWMAIAMAYDTWNESSDDIDVPGFCKTLLEPYDLWNVELNEPDLNEIRNLYRTRC